MRSAYRACAALVAAALTLACGVPVDDSKYEVDDRTPFARIVEAFAQDSQSCETCLSNSCKRWIDECVVTEGCTEFAECVRGQANPAGQASCLSKMVDITFAANVAYTGVQYCWMGCGSQCGVGRNWDCLDGYSVTQPPSDTATVQQSFRYICGGGDAVRGAEIAYCPREGDCTDPVRTDDSGTYSVEIPINLKGPVAGWRGFRRVVGPNTDDADTQLLAPHRLERNLPFWSDHVESTQLLSWGCAMDAAARLEETDDSGEWFLGTIGIQTFDCHTSGAEGVTVEVSTAPDAAILYTASNGSDVSYVKESTTAAGEGLALVSNLPPGDHEIVARETKSGKIVGTGNVTVTVPMNEVILYSLLPRPGGQQ